MFRDAGKAFFGLAFAVVLALFTTFIEPVAAERLEAEAAAAAAVSVSLLSLLK